MFLTPKIKIAALHILIWGLGAHGLTEPKRQTD
jgi:hypothetical protein